MIIDTLALIFGDHTTFFSDRLLTRETIYEEMLRWNVFTDGIRAYEVSPQGTEEFEEDRVWIKTDDKEWPFSFLNLCKNFHIDATSFRHYLLSSKS